MNISHPHKFSPGLDNLSFLLWPRLCVPGQPGSSSLIGIQLPFFFLNFIHELCIFFFFWLLSLRKIVLRFSHCLFFSSLFLVLKGDFTDHRDSSDYRVLTLQARGPEFEPSSPKRPGGGCLRFQCQGGRNRWIPAARLTYLLSFSPMRDFMPKNVDVRGMTPEVSSGCEHTHCTHIRIQTHKHTYNLNSF